MPPLYPIVLAIVPLMLAAEVLRSSRGGRSILRIRSAGDRGPGPSRQRAVGVRVLVQLCQAAREPRADKGGRSSSSSSEPVTRDERESISGRCVVEVSGASDGRRREENRGRVCRGAGRRSRCGEGQAGEANGARAGARGVRASPCFRWPLSRSGGVCFAGESYAACCTHAPRELIKKKETEVAESEGIFF